MRTFLVLCTALSALAQQKPAGAGVPAGGELQIFAIDVEGGKSTLFVAPSGESMLIDTGYDGNNNRDADRILAAVKAAGVDHIEYLVITHYHADHAGGIKQLAARIRIDHFYDHGSAFESGAAAGFADSFAAVYKGHEHQVLKPGDAIPLKGVDVQVVGSAGESIASPLPGAGQPNASCASYKPLPEDKGENAHSVALMITFGNFRASDLGDLHWNREYDLACPVNKLGRVDLYLTTHHGTATSGSPQMLAALRPRAALMNNSASKGGQVKAMETMRASEGLGDLWQLHYSNAGGEKLNSAEPFIANMAEECQGKGIRVNARRDGSFTIENLRNGFSKAYPALN